MTMEVQDVPAIAEAAHRHGAMVALDNTYSAGVYFDAFAHGVDVDHAGADEVHRRAQRPAARAPSRCATRRTTSAWARRCRRSAWRCRPTTAASRCAGCRRWVCDWPRWSGRRSRWRDGWPSAAGDRRACCIRRCRRVRDTTLAARLHRIDECVLGRVPAGRPRARVRAFVDALELFEIGWSWGGVTSLAVPVNPPRTVPRRGVRARSSDSTSGWRIRRT